MTQTQLDTSRVIPWVPAPASPPTANGQLVYGNLDGSSVWQNEYSTIIPVNVCISKISGNDLTANGSPGKPFATINAALTSLGGSPSDITNLKIIDNETYNEKLDFTGISNVNLIGSQASLIYNLDASDAITTNSPLMTIDLFFIEATGGGKTLNNTGTGAVHINATSIQGGAIDNASTGLISIISDDLQVNLPNTGGGLIYYTCNIRSGTNGAGVKGQYPGSVLPTSLPSVNGQLLTGNTDGSVQWDSFSVVQQTFTADGTYTPTTGMVYAYIEAVGGGGAGGGAATSAAGNAAAGGGGGGGEYCALYVSAADVVTAGGSLSVTIGAAGSPGSAGANPGGNGGATNVGGTVLVAAGGSGGTGGTSGTAIAFTNGGNGGGVPTPSGNSLQVGGLGAKGLNFGSSNVGLGGIGGDSRLGRGGRAAATSAGTAGFGHGGGGSGGATGSGGTASAVAGGAGTAGMVIVTEYVIAP